MISLDPLRSGNSQLTLSGHYTQNPLLRTDDLAAEGDLKTGRVAKSPQKVGLEGTGTYIQLTPTSLNFGNQPVGTRSLAKRITLTNKGDVVVNIASISITGVDAKDFAETNTCGKSVASGASCFIKVTFKPLIKGKRTADVSVSDDGGGSPQKVGLTGTGT